MGVLSPDRPTVDFEELGEEPIFEVEPEPPKPVHPPLFAVTAFWIFVCGGLVFGAIFLSNWRALIQRPEVTVNVPGAGPVAIGNLPTLPLSAPAKAVQGAAEPQPKSAPANLVANLLPEWKGTSRVNIVLLGIDKRPDEPVEGTRTDTIMLLSIDPVSKSAALVSLPRDMWVNIPGYGMQRINVAHAVGGPDLTKKTITADFGIPVQYYARVDFSGFEKLVDTVGGVIIDVERPIKDDEYPTEDYGYQRIYVAPGPQLMDGKHALHYARSRHSENDFGRAARQQKVVLAVRDRALQLNMLPKAPELIGIVQSAMSTDIPAGDMLALARLGSEIDRDKVVNIVIDAELATPFVGADGADLLQPNFPAIRAAIDGAIRAASHPELRARIEVLNGSGQPGLGQTAADYLTQKGFDVVRVATADRNDYEQTDVQVLSGNDTAASAVASALGLPATVVSDDPTQSTTSDIRVTIGRGYRVPGR